MVDSLKIALDNQRRWVYPGGILSGTVVIQISEPVKARAVEIRFDGKASSGWTEYEYRYCDKRHHWVNYDAEIIYASYEQVIWRPPSGQSNGLLQPGTHQCRFQFQVPQNAAPTFEGRHGHIRFHLKAKIDRPWRVDDTCFLPFTVLPYFDLNALPYSGHPLLRELHKNLACCCFQYGRMIARLLVNKSGFVPGEAIPIRMEIENNSNQGTHNIEVTLFQIQHYTGENWGCRKMNYHKAQIVGLRKVFVPIKFGNFVYEDLLQIPSCVPSFNYCPIIQVEYTLRVRVEVDILDGVLMCEVPILIGSVPVAKPVEVPRGQIHTENKLVPPEPSAPPTDFTPQVSPAKITAEPQKDYKDGKAPPYNPEYCYYPGLNATLKRGTEQVQHNPKTTQN